MPTASARRRTRRREARDAASPSPTRGRAPCAPQTPAACSDASIAAWERINPELLLYAFLPILLFGDAMQINLYLFGTKARQCVLMAGPGVLMATFATAAYAHRAFKSTYDWDWWTCCVFGCITSATDPVAALAGDEGLERNLLVLLREHLEHGMLVVLDATSSCMLWITTVPK